MSQVRKYLILFIFASVLENKLETCTRKACQHWTSPFLDTHYVDKHREHLNGVLIINPVISMVFVYVDGSIFVQVQHPAAKMLVLASQMQEQEVIRTEFKAEEGMQY